jgi:hypothetical protein
MSESHGDGFEHEVVPSTLVRCQNNSAPVRELCLDIIFSQRNRLDVR